MNKRCSKSLLSLFAIGATLWLVAPPASGQSRPVLSVQVSNGTVRVKITGDVGSNHTIQYCTGLSRTNNWQLLTNLTPLLSSPLSVVDTSANLLIPRFYRAFAQQTVPTNLVPVTNMVWISPGAFVMGSPTNEAERDANEVQHTVTLTKGFYMSKYPVTQGEYLTLIGSNPSYFTGSLSRPVEQVSWIDATNYCARLTQQEQAAGHVPTGWVYRLPTESEWEYACRAGTTTAFHYGNALRGGMANFNDQFEYDSTNGTIFFQNPTIPPLTGTTNVGSYLPNAWGLYDMHGNVSEWCQDWFGDYPTGSVTDPPGSPSGEFRIYRGGGYNIEATFCRSAYRWFDDSSDNTLHNLGFRVVLAQAQP